jgi:hypothetical protein
MHMKEKEFRKQDCVVDDGLEVVVSESGKCRIVGSKDRPLIGGQVFLQAGGLQDGAESVCRGVRITSEKKALHNPQPNSFGDSPSPSVAQVTSVIVEVQLAS